MAEQPLPLTIPKPCHEDWNKMTPNEQGAFCKSCCKTVIDFTNKKTSEIKSFFENLGGKKICGRFNSSQLQPVPVREPSLKQRMSRFVYALYIVFGAFLFTSCGPDRSNMVGELVAINDQDQNPVSADSPVRQPVVMDTTINEQPAIKGEVEAPLKGKVKYVPADTVKKNTRFPVMGKPAYIPADTVKKNECRPLMGKPAFVPPKVMGDVEEVRPPGQDSIM